MALLEGLTASLWCLECEATSCQNISKALRLGRIVVLVHFVIDFLIVYLLRLGHHAYGSFGSGGRCWCLRLSCCAVLFSLADVSLENQVVALLSLSETLTLVLSVALQTGEDADGADQSAD